SSSVAATFRITVSSVSSRPRRRKGVRANCSGPFYVTARAAQAKSCLKASSRISGGDRTRSWYPPAAQVSRPARDITPVETISASSECIESTGQPMASPRCTLACASQIAPILSASAPQGLHDVLVLERLLGPALEDDLAAVDRVEPVRDARRVGEVRLGDQQRDPQVLDLEHRIAEPLDDDRGQTFERLVQKQQRRGERHAARDGDHLALAAAQV